MQPAGLIRNLLLAFVVTGLPGCSGAPEEQSAPPVMTAIGEMNNVHSGGAAKTQPSESGDSPQDLGDVPQEGTYRVRFETSKGDFVVEVHRDWAPIGAEHFYQLVKSGHYDDCRIFRAIDGFMVQFGIAGDPAVQARSRESIKDDPVKQSNQRGFITYAKTRKANSRSTQVFINYGDNARLDSDGFAPFGKVIEGMDVVDSFYSGYGEAASQQQSRIQRQGNAFLDEEFPLLDKITRATIVTGDDDDSAAAASEDDGGAEDAQG